MFCTRFIAVARRHTVILYFDSMNSTDLRDIYASVLIIYLISKLKSVMYPLKKLPHPLEF